jgi:hypothetical protein
LTMRTGDVVTLSCLTVSIVGYPQHIHTFTFRTNKRDGKEREDGRRKRKVVRDFSFNFQLACSNNFILKRNSLTTRHDSAEKLHNVITVSFKITKTIRF